MFLCTSKKYLALLRFSIDPFQKWRYVTWFRELHDKHQNKSYVSEDRFEGHLEVSAQINHLCGACGDVTSLLKWVYDMRTLKFKAQPTNAFFATVNQMFGGSSQFPTMLSELNSTIWFDYRALGSSRKLVGTAEHLIEGSEKRICRLRFEC